MLVHPHDRAGGRPLAREPSQLRVHQKGRATVESTASLADERPAEERGEIARSGVGE
jgi:hypothetical protein